MALRGIKFEGAGSGALARGSGFGGLALTPSGGLAMVTDADAVRQDLILLLTTIPGERVMRPDYGCPLHRLMFAPNDATTAGLAIHYVRQAILRFEPRVEIVRLDAGPEDGGASGQLRITLDYRVRALALPARLEFSLDLAGGA